MNSPFGSEDPFKPAFLNIAEMMLGPVVELLLGGWVDFVNFENAEGAGGFCLKDKPCKLGCSPARAAAQQVASNDLYGGAACRGFATC